MSNKVEQKEFSVHPAIIYSIISKQASGLPKALLELAMNSVDAGASELSITLTENDFVFSDNGKGFKDIEEVESFFGTFGTPHESGDAFYGRYRLGRGQIFCYGKTKWFTKDICMDVDLNIDPNDMGQDAPLGYVITTGHDFHQGCKIVGEFYKPQKVGNVKNITIDNNSAPENMSEVIPAFVKMIKYLPIPVFINGTKVNRDLDSVPFIDSTDEAVFALKQTFNPDNVGSGKNGVVNVYNKGVYAYRVRSTYFTGDVISKESLDLNMARNQAKTTCKVASAITRKIGQLDQKITLSNVKKSRKKANAIDIEITNFVDELWKGLLGFKSISLSEIDEALGEKVFTLANDKRVSIRDVIKQLKQFEVKATESCHPLNLYYYNDEIIESFVHNYRDSMTITRGYIPLSLFPSVEIVKSLSFKIEVPRVIYEERLSDMRSRFLYDLEQHPRLANHRAWIDQDIENVKLTMSTAVFELDQSEPNPDAHFNRLMQYLCSLADFVDSYRKADIYNARQWFEAYRVNMGFEVKQRSNVYCELFKSPIRSVEYVDVSTFESDPILKSAKLSFFEKYVLSAIENSVSRYTTVRNTHKIYSVIGDEVDFRPKSKGKFGIGIREFRVLNNADEPNVLAWTDGSSFVAFNEEYFKQCVKNSDFESLINVALHEMCHLNDSRNSNTHGATFYFAHKVLFSNDFASCVSSFYKYLTLSLLRRKEKALMTGITVEQFVSIVRREINWYVAQAS